MHNIYSPQHSLPRINSSNSLAKLYLIYNIKQHPFEIIVLILEELAQQVNQIHSSEASSSFLLLFFILVLYTLKVQKFESQLSTLGPYF